MYLYDLRWRIVLLIHVYDLDAAFLSDTFGPTARSITRWYNRFLRTGTVEDGQRSIKKSRWPADVCKAVEDYVEKHPTFYIEELQDFLRKAFPRLKNVSESTICRALNFDLKLTRKKLTKAAKEAAPLEVQAYYEKLRPIYSYPEQLLFIDETSRTDAMRSVDMPVPNGGRGPL